ncbi:MAG: RNA polymerase ECF-type sigma factor [Parcubacteria group bacterium GW2011_GWA2_47_8]|nr:MAG: RNA polymerase ECF-type sigma factor [Parcubacteria group bacterium GW2011_GWA2_47_8]
MSLRHRINLRRLNKGDPEAFAQLFDWHGEKLFRHIYYRVSNREIAQDLTSQTFLKVWEYIIRLQVREGDSVSGHTVKPIENSTAFLYRTARNLIIDYYRSKKFEAVTLTEEMEEVLAGSDDTIRGIDHQFNIRRIVQAMSVLKEQDQELVLMRYVNELSMKDVIAITGLNENTIAIRLHRALRTLRQTIEKQEPLL